MLAAILTALAACGDAEDGPAGPGSPEGEGTLRVTAATSGETPDPDGYILSIADFTHRTIASETIDVPGVPAGARTLELSGLAPNCTVEGDNPRVVTVTDDETVTVTFDISCPFALLDVIVFQSDRTGNREIFAIPVAGGDPVNLSNDPGIDWLGTISPDGTRVLIDSERNVDREIFGVSADGQGLANLTDVPFADEAIPFWSPDGTQILFETGRDGNLEVYVMNADGSQQRNLTNMPDSQERFASWSPDGTRILFTSNRDGNNEIYSMRLDGSDLVNLTDHPAEDFMGISSPDGSRIAFTRRVGFDTEVYVMNADGSGQTNLTANPGAADELPDWSPDGSRLAFASTRTGSFEIWTMRPDGTELVQLTDEPTALNGAPRWGPGFGVVPDDSPEPPPTEVRVTAPSETRTSLP